MLRAFFSREEGQGLLEYGLVLILIAIFAVGAIAIFGRKVSSLYTTINSGWSAN